MNGREMRAGDGNDPADILMVFGSCVDEDAAVELVVYKPVAKEIEQAQQLGRRVGRQGRKRLVEPDEPSLCFAPEHGPQEIVLGP